MEPIISRSSRRQSRLKKILDRLLGILIMAICALITGSVYFYLLADVDKAGDAMRVLGQNFGSFVVAVGVSYPAFLGALLPIKINRVNEIERKELLEEVFSFVLTFVIFIFANAFAIIAVHSNLSIKDTVVASMLGSLIGLTGVFIGQINKLLK